MERIAMENNAAKADCTSDFAFQMFVLHSKGYKQARSMNEYSVIL